MTLGPKRGVSVIILSCTYFVALAEQVSCGFYLSRMCLKFNSDLVCFVYTITFDIGY